MNGKSALHLRYIILAPRSEIRHTRKTKVSEESR